MTKNLIVKSVAALLFATSFAQSAQASCDSSGLYCKSSVQNTTSMPSYQSFSSNAAVSGDISVDGLGANEYLEPTSCPVDVNGMETGQSVMGCYKVMKRTQAPTVQPSTPNYYYGTTTITRVVRPVIYVRYPVPTPVYTMPMHTQTPAFYPAMPLPNMCGGMMPPPMIMGRCYR